jgi:predicted kinase
MGLCLITLVGHNGSGKTTLSKKLSKSLNLNRVNGDDFRRFVIENIPYFKGHIMSMPTDLSRQLHPLVIEYRMHLAEILLKAGQSVLFDGSGATKETRAVLRKHFSDNLPNLKQIIIYCNPSEEELLRRLRERDQNKADNNWERQYKEIKSAAFEPPTPKECDELLIYTQDNFQGIENTLKNFLNA